MNLCGTVTWSPDSLFLKGCGVVVLVQFCPKGCKEDSSWLLLTDVTENTRLKLNSHLINRILLSSCNWHKETTQRLEVWVWEAKPPWPQKHWITLWRKSIRRLYEELWWHLFCIEIPVIVCSVFDFLPYVIVLCHCSLPQNATNAYLCMTEWPN